MILQIAIAAVAVVVVWFVLSTFNTLVVVKNNVHKSWANIDVLLKQRHDEIPNLVRVCEGYAQFERSTLELVVRARAAASSARGPAERGAAEGWLGAAVGRVFAVAESYPDLKASAQFRQLQTRISELESQIADRREFYNDSVNTLNTRIEQIPYNVVAGLLGYRREEMFTVDGDQRRAPDIRLSLHT